MGFNGQVVQRTTCPKIGSSVYGIPSSGRRYGPDGWAMSHDGNMTEQTDSSPMEMDVESNRETANGDRCFNPRLIARLVLDPKDSEELSVEDDGSDDNDDDTTDADTDSDEYEDDDDHYNDQDDATTETCSNPSQSDNDDGGSHPHPHDHWNLRHIHWQYPQGERRW